MELLAIPTTGQMGRLQRVINPEISQDLTRNLSFLRKNVRG